MTTRAEALDDRQRDARRLGYEGTPGAMIEVEAVCKSFGLVRALDNVDLVVRPATVQGLLGPNGARQDDPRTRLATLLAPESGRARVAGVDVERDPHAVRTVIGLAGQYPAVDESLTGRENLLMAGRLYRAEPPGSDDESRRGPRGLLGA
ncbi:MAG TPA: hypothetical protein VHF24_14450 [Acidimicrobiales bacterium]|nr:hypothetical protein [Acidimicrobiales bacterium]